MHKAALDTEVTAKLATGSYVPPQAGLVTVKAVYNSWSTSQGHISAKTAATRNSAWNSRVKPHWGKTETYLLYVLTAAFYDRLRGKREGITSWGRFPLRMLSLQQTQRFADVIAL